MKRTFTEVEFNTFKFLLGGRAKTAALYKISAIALDNWGKNGYIPKKSRSQKHYGIDWHDMTLELGFDPVTLKLLDKENALIKCSGCEADFLKGTKDGRCIKKYGLCSECVVDV